MKKTLLYVACLLLCPLSSLLAEDKEFVILVSSWNSREFVKKNLDSVFSQSYDHFRVVYLDKDSQDGTADCVQDYIQKHSLYSRISLLKGHSLSEIYRSCSPDKILLFLDGSDWLAHRDALKQLNAVYANPEVWFTYGQYCAYQDFPEGMSRQSPSPTLDLPISLHSNPSHVMQHSCRSFRTKS